MYMFKIILPKLKLKVEKWKWNKEYRVYVSNFGNFKDEHKNNMPVKISSVGGYVDIKNNDNIKNQYCKQHTIPMMRIPYYHLNK